MYFYFKKVKSLLYFFLFFLFTVPVTAQILEKLPAAGCQPGDKRIQVLLLASYRMSRAGTDKLNPKGDDVLSPKRQAEIEQLTSKFSAFKPNKIAVEFPYGDPAANNHYRQYVKGELHLQPSEAEQIGFRLAKQLGHDQIYPIDVRIGLNSSVIKRIVDKDPDLRAQMTELQNLENSSMTVMSKWLTEGTVGDMLYQMNRPEMLMQTHLPFVLYLTPIAEGNNYAGADVVGDWYKRNLRIFANINRMAEPGDRIMIIYRLAHVPILRELIGQSTRFCRVDPLPFLKTQKKRKR
jgi:hypothetical protein